MDEQVKLKLHAVYGLALVLAGIGVIYRIPQVMPKITQFAQFEKASGFIYFCLYLLAFTLIFGGGRKIYNYYKSVSGRGNKS
jgi:hypothetical protein